MGNAYICCAGENQVTNLLPLRHYGIERFSHVLVLIGCNDRSSEFDRRVAIEPAERFKQLIRALAKDADHEIHIEFIEAKPDVAIDWATQLELAYSRIQVDGSILNLTSGTRPMIFGALAAFQEETGRSGDQNSQAILYLAPPPRIQVVHPSIESRENPIDAANRLTFTDWIRLRGIHEENRPRREAKQKAAIERRDLTRSLYALLCGRSQSVDDPETAQRIVSDAVAAMHGAVHPFRNTQRQRGVAFVHRTFTNREERQREIIDQIIENLGCEQLSKILHRENDKYYFSLTEGCDYFGGGWFEELVYLYCRDRLADLASSWNDVHLNIVVPVDPQKADREGELDVVVQVDGQPHLLECKAKRYGEGVRPQDVQTLAKWRDSLLGPRGQIILLSLQPLAAQSSARLQREAELNRVMLMTGSRVLNALDDWLRKL